MFFIPRCKQDVAWDDCLTPFWKYRYPLCWSIKTFGLAFPRLAKVISRKVWHFRAWRKSFLEGFDISALGESHFPNSLAFPRMAKVISRRVWHFRAWRKSFPERFGISAHGKSRFPSGLRLSPRDGKYFPKGLKCERIIYLWRNKNKITSEESDTC